MHVVVAVKQVPSPHDLVIDPNGRLRRDGVSLEMSAYCRRAVAKGVELAAATSGRCSVVSLGPPTAEDVLREALACGADDAVLLTDPQLAGSDTLVTARALAALVKTLAPFDLVLVGKTSLDAETGQVGPQLAELLDLPFAGAVRELDLDPSARSARVRCEQDDGGRELVLDLPAVLALAERCCRPAKASPAAFAAVEASRVRRAGVADLDAAGPWGEEGSPTKVEGLEPVGQTRAGTVCTGSLGEQVAEAARLLSERGALGDADGPAAPRRTRARVPAPSGSQDGPLVAALLEPGRPGLDGELLGAAATLGATLGGRVVALASSEVEPAELWSKGADSAVVLAGSAVEEDIARGLSTWVATARPEVVLAPATSFGREVASRVAARLGAGLVADALDLELADGRLRCAKPAGGGGSLATIVSVSPVQMATLRPGVLAAPVPRDGAGRAELDRLELEARGRVTVVERWHDDEVEALERAEVVLGVGRGVAPEDYEELHKLATRLDAELGATRKVTDQGLLPRSRQIGITGRNVAPRLYLALGVGGSPNHLAGVRRAGTVLAVNADPDAPVFRACDVGLVGDWRDVLPALLDAVAAAAPAPQP